MLCTQMSSSPLPPKSCQKHCSCSLNQILNIQKSCMKSKKWWDYSQPSFIIFLSCFRFFRWGQPESRIHHYSNAMEVGQQNAQSDVTAPPRIKIHPFFVMRYGLNTPNPKQQQEAQGQSSRSPRQHNEATSSRGFNRHLEAVPEWRTEIYYFN